MSEISCLKQLTVNHFNLPSSGSHVAQRSFQIGPKILDGLDTHAQPQQRRRQVLLPRNAGPPFDGGLDRAQAGGVLDELQSGAHGGGGVSPRTSNEIIVPKPFS